MEELLAEVFALDNEVNKLFALGAGEDPSKNADQLIALILSLHAQLNHFRSTTRKEVKKRI
jgi:hypothetical protein